MEVNSRCWKRAESQKIPVLPRGCWGSGLAGRSRASGPAISAGRVHLIDFAGRWSAVSAGRRSVVAGEAGGE
eukprot:8355728-Alexandrium_andersonii.AAC.1